MEREKKSFAVIPRQLVLKKLAQTFPDPTTAKEALECLDTYDESDGFTNLVHLAIIKLSEGMLWRLRELVREVRKTNFRNTSVLQAARAPEQHKLFEEQVRVLKTGGDIRFLKKISPKSTAAMEKRDEAQWNAWLSCE